MDMKKSGELFAKLRTERGMTQKQVADILEISPKTVSKWERGRGFPDISLIAELSGILGVSTDTLLNGDILKNAEGALSMKKTEFYVCPHCQSFMQGIGESEVVCCGSKVEPCKVHNDTAEHEIRITDNDGEWFIRFNHEMSKEHYIEFVAYVTFDRVLTVRMYPEQSPEVRIPQMRGGCLYYYCNRHGLYKYTQSKQSNTKQASGSSMTALMSAFSRAYLTESNKGVNIDRYARGMFTDSEYESIKEYISEAADDIDEYIRTNLAPTPVARSLFCRECLKNEIKSGAEQYVVIASGYDTSVYENIDANLRIYEIDKETTISDKLRRLARAGIKTPDNIRYIKADLNKFGIGAALMTSDFDREKKTIFSCLGLLYYLSDKSIDRLFEGLASVSTNGSAVVLDVPDSHCFSSELSRVKNMVAMAEMSGEPMLSCFDYTELERMLEKHGFLIYEFLNPKEIQKRYMDKGLNMTAFEHINYVLAVYKGK